MTGKPDLKGIRDYAEAQREKRGGDDLTIAVLTVGEVLGLLDEIERLTAAEDRSRSDAQMLRHALEDHERPRIKRLEQSVSWYSKQANRFRQALEAIYDETEVLDMGDCGTGEIVHEIAEAALSGEDTPDA